MSLVHQHDIPCKSKSQKGIKVDMLVTGNQKPEIQHLLSYIICKITCREQRVSPIVHFTSEEVSQALSGPLAWFSGSSSLGHGFGQFDLEHVLFSYFISLIFKMGLAHTLPIALGCPT